MFDPLHQWLGIPASEQPPTHYRLLGLSVGESDPDVIDAAADRALAFLHSVSGGEHQEHAETLANEVSLARLCLIDDDQRRQYDESLTLANLGATETKSAESKPGETKPGEQTVLDGDAVDSANRKSPAWHISHGDGNRQGPFTASQMAIAIKKQTIAPNTLVFHARRTSGQWIAAQQCFASAFEMLSSSTDRDRAYAGEPVSPETPIVQIVPRRSTGRRRKSAGPIFMVLSLIVPMMILSAVFWWLYQSRVGANVQKPRSTAGSSLDRNR